jgi:hypothetical protein
LEHEFEARWLRRSCRCFIIISDSRLAGWLKKRKLVEHDVVTRVIEADTRERDR